MTARLPNSKQPHSPSMKQLQKVPLFPMQCPSFVSRTPGAKVHRDHLKRISIISERYRLHCFFAKWWCQDSLRLCCHGHHPPKAFTAEVRGKCNLCGLCFIENRTVIIIQGPGHGCFSFVTWFGGGGEGVSQNLSTKEEAWGQADAWQGFF